MQWEFSTGPPTGPSARDNRKDVPPFINWKPFRDEESTPLQGFNIGDSAFADNQHHAPAPQASRTVASTSGNSILGVLLPPLNSNAAIGGAVRAGLPGLSA